MELIFSALLSVFLEEIADSEEEYSHFLLLNNSSSALTDPLHFFIGLQPTGAWKWYGSVQLNGFIL